MTIHSRDLLFYAGGAAFQKYDVSCMRRAPAFRGGEEIIETFSRTGTAYFKDRSGVLRLAEANALRPHWMDLDGDGIFETCTLRLEDARTNVWTYSEQFDNVAWTADLVNASISANAAVAPDGTTTADKIVENGTGGSHGIFDHQISGCTNDTETSVSFFLKAAERTWCTIGTRTKANDTQYTSFNLSTGAEGTTGGGSHSHTIRIEAYGNGWWEISITFDVGSGGTTPSVLLYTATADNQYIYTGDGSSGIYVWGGKAEVDQPCASSYIQTVAASATRNAENDSYPAYFPATGAKSLYCKFVEAGTSLVHNARLLTLGGNNGPRQLLYFATYYTIYSQSSAGSVVSTPSTVPNLGDVVEFASTIADTGIVQAEQSINGAASESGSASAANALDPEYNTPTAHLNCQSGASYVGFVELIAAIVARGTHTLDEFRELLP